ncbi:MAG: hypothetical protein AAF911_06750 [Planctomycetota bacterium]
MDRERQDELQEHANALLVYSKLFGYFTIVIGCAAMLFGLYAITQNIVTGLFIVL